MLTMINTPEQQLETIKRIGRKMREAQSAYFKYKAAGQLNVAKALERDFDKLVAEAPSTQINLPL